MEFTITLFTLVIVTVIVILIFYYNHKSTQPVSEYNNPYLFSRPATIVKITASSPVPDHTAYQTNLFAVLFQFNDNTRLCLDVRFSSVGSLVVGEHGMLTYEDKNPHKRFVRFEPDKVSTVSHQSDSVTESSSAPISKSTPSSPVPAVIVRLSSIDSKALFELTDGSRVNLTVPSAVFAFLREGMRGQLSYQGDTFQLFTPDASPSSPSF